MDKPIPEAVERLLKEARQPVNTEDGCFSPSVAAFADKIEAALTAAQQQGGGEVVMPDLWRACNVRNDPHKRWPGPWREVLTIERDGFQTCDVFLTDRMRRPEYEVEFAWKDTALPSAPVGVEGLPADGAYLIVYDDADVQPEAFALSGARDAALARFEQVSGYWNAHLYAKIKSNTRDCEAPDALAQQPAAVECPHRTRCDCLASCKYGYASDGATQHQEPTT